VFAIVDCGVFLFDWDFPSSFPIFISARFLGKQQAKKAQQQNHDTHRMVTQNKNNEPSA